MVPVWRPWTRSLFLYGRWTSAPPPKATKNPIRPRDVRELTGNMATQVCGSAIMPMPLVPQPQHPGKLVQS
eukprot:3976286-Heterocapsa_arctica.AAC.1